MKHPILLRAGRRFLVAPGIRGGERTLIPFSAVANHPRNDEEFLTDQGVLCLWDKKEVVERLFDGFGIEVGEVSNPQVTKVIRHLRRFDDQTRYLPRGIAACCGRAPFTSPPEKSAWR